MVSYTRKFVCLWNSFIARIMRLRLTMVCSGIPIGRISGLLIATTAIITASLARPTAAMAAEDRTAKDPFLVSVDLPAIGKLFRATSEQWAIMMQDLTESISSSSAAMATEVRTAKDPVIVSVDLPSVGKLFSATQEQWAIIVQDIAETLETAIQENPGRLVTLDPGRNRLFFSILPIEEQERGIELAGEDASLLYEEAMSDLLDQVIETAHASHRNSAISVMGLPIDLRRVLPEELQTTNQRYQNVIDDLSAFVSYRSFILLGSREVEQYTVYRGMPEAFRLRDGRPIVFRTNQDWRILFGDDLESDDFEFQYTRLAEDDASSDEDLQITEEELALNDLTEEEELDEEILDLNKKVVLQHDPYSAPSGGAGGGGGGRSRRSKLGSGGSGGGGGGGAGGGGTPTEDDQSDDGDGGAGTPPEDGQSDGGGDQPDGGDEPDGGGDEPDGGDDGGWEPGDEVDGDADDPPDDDFPDGGDDGDDGDGGDNGDSGEIPDGAPVIPPGDGFSSPTSEPGAIGSPSDAGYDAKVIAHFDVVPYQTFDGDFNFGVVAFHINGIDRVEFSAEGGSWTPVTEMTLNPRTNVWEYWAVLQAADFKDGPVEVRVIAYPKDAGEPRLLSYNYELTNGSETFGCQLYANATGVLPNEVRYVNPGESIVAAAQSIEAAQGGNAGGGTIYLTAGDHALPSSNVNSVNIDNRWLTIAGAPGTTVDQVRITSGGHGFNNGLIHLKDLSLISAGIGGSGAAWGDSLILQGSGVTDYTRWHTGWAGWTSGTFITESEIQDFNMPMVRMYLMRNLVMNNIGRDLLRDPAGMVVNIVATHHGFGPPSEHSDFLQWYHPNITEIENFIFYNVMDYKAHGQIQGIYDAGNDAITRNDVAFVNVHIDRIGNTADEPPNSHWLNLNTNHFLLWNVTHENIKFFLQSPLMTNVSVRGCSWDLFLLPPSNDYEYAFSNNNYIMTSTYQAFYGGVDATVGDPGYVNAAENDYRPGPNSPLLDRLNVPIAVSDALGLQRSTGKSPPCDVGAFEHE